MPKKLKGREAKNTLWVVTGEPVEVRGSSQRFREIDVDAITVNVNMFVTKMGSVLEKTPEDVGKFKLREFEVYAEFSGEGQLMLLGTGGKVGGMGGIKFVFSRSS